MQTKDFAQALLGALLRKIPSDRCKVKRSLSHWKQNLYWINFKNLKAGKSELERYFEDVLGQEKKNAKPPNQQFSWFLGVDDRAKKHDFNRRLKSEDKPKLTRWWFQPIWKILVKLDDFPK